MNSNTNEWLFTDLDKSLKSYELIHNHERKKKFCDCEDSQKWYHCGGLWRGTSVESAGL